MLSAQELGADPARAVPSAALRVLEPVQFDATHWVTTYDSGMLPALRDTRGRPAAPMRLLAALVALGMLALAAPALVVFARWMIDILR